MTHTTRTRVSPSAYGALLLNGLLASLLTGLVLAGSALSIPAAADEFTQGDLAEWQAQYMDSVKKGRELFTDARLGSNGVSCAQCHPNAANTHPETYPKFQKQLGRVVPQWEMINWCIENPLQGKPLAADDPRLIALQAYIAYERRGKALAPGKH